MATESLRSVVQDAIENDWVVRRNLVEACRLGSGRALHRVSKGVKFLAGPRALDLKGTSKVYALLASHGVAHGGTKAVNFICDKADATLARVYNGAADVLVEASTRAEDVQNEYAAQSMQVLSRLLLPAAQLARTMSERMADGATQLADLVERPHFRKSAKRRYR
ncbi:MAG: hypothetical protein ABW110_14320 [Steroidobacteraceae bacterium]